MVNLGFLLIKQRGGGRSIAPRDELHHFQRHDPLWERACPAICRNAAAKPEFTATLTLVDTGYGSASFRNDAFSDQFERCGFLDNLQLEKRTSRVRQVFELLWNFRHQGLQLLDLAGPRLNIFELTREQVVEVEHTQQRSADLLICGGMKNGHDSIEAVVGVKGQVVHQHVGRSQIK